jgi:hypothetical protein
MGDLHDGRREPLSNLTRHENRRSPLALSFLLHPSGAYLPGYQDFDRIPMTLDCFRGQTAQVFFEAQTDYLNFIGVIHLYRP